MYEVTVEDSFAAGHYLRDYKGKCENPHGHNYKVRVTLTGPTLDKAGLLLDFKPGFAAIAGFAFIAFRHPDGFYGFVVLQPHQIADGAVNRGKLLCNLRRSEGETLLCYPPPKLQR